MRQENRLTKSPRLTMKIRKTIRLAFTLIELLLVLAILGVIMSMVIPNLLGRQKYANIDATKGSIKGAEQALRMYALDHLGEFPTTSEGFSILVKSPGQNDSRWRGPYLNSIPTDAWGAPLTYQYPGRHNQEEFDISSRGPDKIAGTADDIGNWLEATNK